LNFGTISHAVVLTGGATLADAKTNERSREDSAPGNASPARAGIVGVQAVSLLPQFQTSTGVPLMSAKCQNRHRMASFDYLVGCGKQTLRHIEAERLRGLEIDHKLKLGRLLNR